MDSSKQSTQKKNEKQDQQKDGVNMCPKGEASGSNMDYESGDGITTPLTSDASRESSDLSDSAFEFEVERNWSMIFTDDNYSTDHDIRSNFSSSEESSETGASNGVISETESEVATSATTASPSTSVPGAKRMDTSSTLKFVQEETGNSVSTLKATETPMEGSFSFPDPIKNVDVGKQSILSKRADSSKRVAETPAENKTDQVGGNNPSFQLPKTHVLYGLMLLLSLDILVQILNGNSVLSNLRSSLYDSPEVADNDPMKTLTIIRYATKTETRYLPGETKTVELTVPYETVISEKDYDKTQDEKAEHQFNDEDTNNLVEKSRSSTKVLFTELFCNLKDDTISGVKSVSKYSSKMLEDASKSAYLIYHGSKRLNKEYTSVAQDGYEKLSNKVPSSWKTSSFVKAKSIKDSLCSLFDGFDGKSHVDLVKGYFKESVQDTFQNSISEVSKTFNKDNKRKFYDSIYKSIKYVDAAYINTISCLGNSIIDFYKSQDKNAVSNFMKDSRRVEFLEAIGDMFNSAQKTAKYLNQNTLSFLNNKYIGLRKLNGPLDRLKSKLVLGIKSLGEQTSDLKKSTIDFLDNEWNNEKSSFNMLKKKSFNFACETKEKVFGTDTLKKARYGGKKTWFNFKSKSKPISNSIFGEKINGFVKKPGFYIPFKFSFRFQ